MPLLSRLYNVIVDRTREWRIRDVVRELRRTEPSRATILPLVVRLRDAWGNTGWSADLGFLEAVVVEGLESSGPFLECGAGLSTVRDGAEGLPAVGEAARALLDDPDLAWRAFACAMLAEQLADE